MLSGLTGREARGVRTVGRPLLIAIVSGFMAVGCAQNPSAPVAATEQPAAPESAAPAEHPAETTAAPLMPLKDIIRLIENGQDDQARAALVTFLAKTPKNPQALLLQRQLTTDPRSMMGAHTEKYTIQNGDTLGGLAQKYFGNSLKFVALARYNHIQRSRDLRVGQVIEVPSVAVGAAAASSTATAEEPDARSAATVEPAAPADAPSSSSTPAVTPASAPPAAPVPASVERGHRVAIKPAVPAEAPSEDAKALEQRGMSAYKKQHWEAAYTALSAAVAASPGIEPATSTLASLKPQLVRHYHEAALVDFRQQNLDQAIALWDKALAIDPTYEPALGYRARALELQRRLNQLDKK
ncbi:LysM peptidoglycan-binding domain-containing protein [Halothiobacillus sp. DCM-1]|uniref:LysM peptidoglycan-binding domain-containing protein n=1 Tax=Halothiobacillus sp. DCM-1 TaxID=3112558 RepID=UPI00325109D1